MNIKRTVIFAGAGASYAVNASKYPTTVGFLEKLPDNVKKDKLIHHLASHFEARFGDSTPDVEKILWCLDELSSFLGLLEDRKSPANWLIPNNALPGILGMNANISPLTSVAQTALQRAKKLRDQINAQLYEVYSDPPDDKETSGNWNRLLKELVAQNHWVDVVTTNYDLVIETVVDNIECGIGYGQTLRGGIPKLDLLKWKNYLTTKELPYKSGLVTKLHGSLNWQRGRGEVVLSGPNFRSDHKHHVAIYPGFKGIPAEEPFNLLHDYFERILQEADHIVFIGFAFRDECINTLLRRSFSQKQYIAIDPSELVELPSDLRPRFHHLKTSFDSGTVKKALDLIGT